MKFCPNCGKRFNDSEVFCSSCSTQLKQTDDENNFKEGLAQAGKAAKNAVENAFNEENREKVKNVANEAMDAIKNTDIEKGKKMANEGINKIKTSKYGTIAIIFAIIIAIGIFFMGGNSDEKQVKKLAENYAEFILENDKSLTVSDDEIEKIVKQTEPELQKEFEGTLKKQQAQLEKMKSNEKAKEKLEERAKKVKDASFDVSEVKITGDRGYAIVSFKNYARKEMQVFVVRKNDGKWYNGYIYFDDDVHRK